MPLVTLHQLRLAAREIFDAGWRAVDAREVTRHTLTIQENRVVTIFDTHLRQNKPIYAVSIGKAAFGMSIALDEQLGERLSSGIISCGYQPGEALTPKWQCFTGGHPLPTAESVRAAQAAFQILERANVEEANVIFAISGGGSAMIEWPVSPDISLADLQQANRVLVSCGASIAEINTIRRAFSAVKGGKLAAIAPNAHIVTLIISDTNAGDEASVASGPTIVPANTGAPASDVIAQYQLASELPETIVRAIQQQNQGAQLRRTESSYYVIADSSAALEAAAVMARSLGFQTHINNAISEQPIAEGCKELLRQKFADGPSCYISGGEFACPVRGAGIGGRNLETALRCAMSLDQPDGGHTIVLSAGTDGIDGNSPAAGAIADETTLQRARSLQLDPEDFLARSDSFNFLNPLGDTIVTGPTGTNVRDLRLVLRTNMPL